VPTRLAAYELLHLAAGASTLLALVVAAGINNAVCQFEASAVGGAGTFDGIVLSGIVAAYLT
jgi:uncharacterized membrane protein